MIRLSSYLDNSINIKCNDVMTQNPNVFREAKSNVDFLPIRDTVLFAFTYMVSPTAIVSEKLPYTQYQSNVVAGYGEMTYGFEIGDIGIVSKNVQNIAPYLIDIPSNLYSLTHTRKMFDLLTKEEVSDMSRSRYKVKLIDYIAIPLFDIVGFYHASSVDGQYIVSLKGSKLLTRDQAVERFDVNDKRDTKTV